MLPALILSRQGRLPTISPLRQTPPPPPPSTWNYQDCHRPTSYLTDESSTPVQNKIGQAGIVSTRARARACEEGTASAGDGGVGRVPSNGAIDGQVGRSDDCGAVANARFRRSIWALFLGGKFFSAAVVIFEIWLTLEFFRKFLREADNVTNGSAGSSDSDCHGSASSLRVFVMITLVFGLFADAVFAVGLSFVYRSPLDIKSANKIPHDDMRNCVVSMAVNIFAPLSWGVIYTCGGTVAFELAALSSCLGHGGSGPTAYLFYSGLYMVFVGLQMFGVSVLMFFISCGSPTKCIDSCWAAVSELYAHRILSMAAFLDIFWQLQCAVWLYLMDAVGVAGLITLLLSGVAGGVLATFGSLAPDVVEEQVGPLPLVVESRPPDEAKKPY